MPRYDDNISISVIRRLPRYLRFLEALKNNGVVKISSKELASRMGLTASQIRQDLNCFGEFGQQGYGYSVPALYDEIKKILGLNHAFKTIMIGAGNLGRAVAMHLYFEGKGFDLIGIFDKNKALEGEKLNGIEIMLDDKIEQFCKEYAPEAAVLCVPDEAAETLCAKLASYGIKGSWNFTHYDITVAHPDAVVENVHLGDGLMTLCYKLSEQQDS